MTINVSANPLVFDTTISGSMPNINISADVLFFKTNIKAVFSSYPALSRDPSLDLYYDCLGFNSKGEDDQGVLVFSPIISGNSSNTNIINELISFNPTISGSFINSLLIVPDTLSFNFNISGTMIIEPAKTSWVRWSKIGSLDFTIDHSNEAGERPMDWTGAIYDILKLNNSIVIYGANGISVMSPNEVYWKYKTVSKIGTAGRNAQISNSTNTKHWFIDSYDRLFEISDQLIKLDYAEFLSNLSNPVISLDEYNNFLYICDGNKGYAYSIDNRSLCACAPNISGFGIKNNIIYAVADDTITLPTIEFTTDIYDFGTRKEKTIFNLEFHTDVNSVMEASISYRVDHTASFVQTPWVQVTPQGIAYLNCYGREFKFHFRMSSFASFTLDQMKINGVLHGFSFLDSVRKEN